MRHRKVIVVSVILHVRPCTMSPKSYVLSSFQITLCLFSMPFRFWPRIMIKMYARAQSYSIGFSKVSLLGFLLLSWQEFKDVVSEAEIPPKIGQLIRERIYAKEATARLFIAGWIVHLTGNPNAGFGEVLPAIIDGLFRALDDKQANVQRLVANALQGLVSAFVKQQFKMSLIASMQETSRSDISQLLPIVAEQLRESSSNSNWQLRYNSLLWLRHLVPINYEITVKSAAVCIRVSEKIKSIKKQLRLIQNHRQFSI